MESLNIELKRFIFNNEVDTYYVYIHKSIDGDDKGFTSFHIQRKDYGYIQFCIALKIEELDCSLEEFINDEINDWVESYEIDLGLLENREL